MAKSEREIQNEIRLFLGKRGWLCFRCNVGTVETADGRYFTTGLPDGFPDLLAIGPGGNILFIEVKTATGKQRQAQKRMQKVLTELGHTYVVARAVNDLFQYIN